MSPARFYGGWLRRAFKPPLVIGQAVSFLLFLAGGFVSRFRPEIGGQLSYLLWLIPLAVFLAALAAGLIFAPYAMYRELEANVVGSTERNRRRSELGALSTAGQGLHHRLCRRNFGDRLSDDEWAAYSEWIRSIEEYLGQHFDAGYVARFNVNTGVNPSFRRRQHVCGDILERLGRLTEFIKELSVVG